MGVRDLYCADHAWAKSYMGVSYEEGRCLAPISTAFYFSHFARGGSLGFLATTELEFGDRLMMLIPYEIVGGSDGCP